MTSIEGTSERFAARFGGKPRLFRAPGRINVIGEHTDYSDGFVMPAAIDRWCEVAAAPAAGQTLTLYARALEAAAVVELDGLAPRGDWTDYVCGVAKILRLAGVPVSGANLYIDSNVPIGAGVSSSAAIEVAVAHALLGLAGYRAEAPQIARWAQAAENNFVGMPCGIMDQFASAGGVAGSALVLDCRSLAVDVVAMPADARFLLINSMAPHAHADGDYRSRRADCEAAAAALDKPALRDVPLADLPLALEKLSGGSLKRCRHVVTENARVLNAASAMRQGDLAALGELMNQSHASLRDDMEVSLPIVDQLAALAQATPGVYGARMMGGGFGGCVIALVDASAAAAAQAAIVEAYGKVIGKVPDAFVCQAVAGAGEVVE